MARFYLRKFPCKSRTFILGSLFFFISGPLIMLSLVSSPSSLESQINAKANYIITFPAAILGWQVPRVTNQTKRPNILTINPINLKTSVHLNIPTTLSTPSKIKNGINIHHHLQETPSTPSSTLKTTTVRTLRSSSTEKHTKEEEVENKEDADKINKKEIPEETEEGEAKHHQHLKHLKPNLIAQPPSDPRAPGEQGKPFFVNKTRLRSEEQKEYERGWKDNQFNQYVSDRISLRRILPDYRHKLCKKVKYSDDLPDTSVIIIFHNEAWSTLLRTVHSVIDRSPEKLIKEIILVDDFSTFDHLKRKLEEYIEQLEKVKVLRTKAREGLIRARLLGASHAQGSILTFLDSHCECTEGWLEPLLQPIAENRTNVVCPVIDVIDDSTLQYQGGGTAIFVGGFEWQMYFNWHAMPEEERKRRKSLIDPVRSPTMAGGLFSISKWYFEYLGTYDQGFEIWGGENLEISFKIWMCGGQLLILPCSRVGHIFRKVSPYSWGAKGTNALTRNTNRLVEVWLDEYKYYYKLMITGLNNVPDIGENIESRKKLREKLKCKSFSWYLDHVYPTIFNPKKMTRVGEIRSATKNVCLDASSSTRSGYPRLHTCHGLGVNQNWFVSERMEIRKIETCLDYNTDRVRTFDCHAIGGNQQWILNDSTKQIQHKVSQKCLEMAEDGERVEMKVCNDSQTRQRWIFPPLQSFTSSSHQL